MKTTLNKNEFIRKPMFPFSLSNFKDEETNHMAYTLFNDFIEQYDLGKTIALVRYKLDKLGYDLRPKEPQTIKQILTPEIKQKEPETPSLFTWNELKYS